MSDKEVFMIGFKMVTVVGALLITMTSPSLAFQCPSLVAKIDAAPADASNLSKARADEIKVLRDDGAARHDSGDHGGSVVVLEEALNKLGQSGGSSSGRADY